MDKKNKNPNVPNLRFEKFNNNWSRTTISKVCVCNPKNEDKLDDEFIYIDLESVEKGVLKSKNIIHLKNAPSRAQRILYKNDILFQSVRPYQRNNYLLNEDDDFLQYVASTGYIQLRTTLNPYFLFQLLNTDKINNEVMLRCTGTSYPAINSNDFSNILITITNDRNEQNKIAKFFSLIEERIQTQIKIIELKQSLIKDIEDRILWKTTNTQTKPIREFLTEINNKSIIQNQYPLLSSTKKGLFLQTDYFNKEAASSNNIGYKIVHKGDIIISPQNLWMGNITYNDKFDNGLVSPSYRIYKVKEEYNAFYISRILMSYRALSLYKNISEQGASIVRRNLNVDAFNELCFPIPNIKKQDEVGLFLSKLHQELKCETWILMQLKSQKNYLLNNMFI